MRSNDLALTIVALAIVVLSWAQRHPPLGAMASIAFCIYVAWRVAKSLVRDVSNGRIQYGRRLKLTPRGTPIPYSFHLALRLALLAFLLYASVFLIREMKAGGTPAPHEARPGGAGG